MNRKLLLTPFCLLVICACSSAESQDNTKAKPVLAKAPAVPVKSGGQAVVGDRIKGKVVETMDSAGYTYVAVDVGNGGVVWAAGRQAPVKVGDIIDVEKGTQMTNFTSRTLQRNFDAIYFVASLGPQGTVAPTSAPTSAPTFNPSKSPTSAPTSNPSKSPTGTPQTGAVKAVSKADGGLTIEEIFSQASTLAGKEVLVRGRVVKFNGGIMGKNWFHLQDGTGDAAAKNHDLTVTSDATVAVGATVLIKGLLTKDKDLGSGYKYPVIIENATIVEQ